MLSDNFRTVFFDFIRDVQNQIRVLQVPNFEFKGCRKSNKLLRQLFLCGVAEYIMEKESFQAEIFANRIRKKYKFLRKRARKNFISCFRIYDRDIPEIPLSLDIYEFLPNNIHSTDQCALFLAEQNRRFSANDLQAEKEAALRRYFVLYLYERPYEKSEESENAWLELMAQSICSVLDAERRRIIIKTRKKQRGENQYDRINSANIVSGIVQECGSLFKVDLLSYIDTGLFFDHRPLRSVVRESSKGKRVLNLFCYTGSFSVYAASGGASYVESVDLSNTYLSWARFNMELNGFVGEKYNYVRTDVTEFLCCRVKDLLCGKTVPFDIIILDPPTFSNSKNTENLLDINKDWAALVNDCLKLLVKGGILYFSTNSRRIQFDETKINSSCTINDITESTIPFDFEGTKPHRCWRIKKQ